MSHFAAFKQTEQVDDVSMSAAIAMNGLASTTSVGDASKDIDNNSAVETTMDGTLSTIPESATTGDGEAIGGEESEQLIMGLTMMQLILAGSAVLLLILIIIAVFLFIKARKYKALWADKARFVGPAGVEEYDRKDIKDESDVTKLTAKANVAFGAGHILVKYNTATNKIEDVKDGDVTKFLKLSAPLFSDPRSTQLFFAYKKDTANDKVRDLTVKMSLVTGDKTDDKKQKIVTKDVAINTEFSRIQIKKLAQMVFAGAHDNLKEDSKYSIAVGKFDDDKKKVLPDATWEGKFINDAKLVTIETDFEKTVKTDNKDKFGFVIECFD